MFIVHEISFKEDKHTKVLHHNVWDMRAQQCRLAYMGYRPMGEKVISESITPHMPFLGPAFVISLEDRMTNGLGSNTP